MIVSFSEATVRWLASSLSESPSVGKIRFMCGYKTVGISAINRGSDAVEWINATSDTVVIDAMEIHIDGLPPGREVFWSPMSIAPDTSVYIGRR